MICSQNSARQHQLESLQRRIDSLKSSIQQENGHLNQLEAERTTAHPRRFQNLRPVVSHKRLIIKGMEDNLKGLEEKKQAQATDFYRSTFEQFAKSSPATSADGKPQLCVQQETVLKQIQAAHGLSDTCVAYLRCNTCQQRKQPSPYLPWLMSAGILVAIGLVFAIARPLNSQSPSEETLIAPSPYEEKQQPLDTAQPQPSASDGWLLLGTASPKDTQLEGAALTGTMPISKAVVPTVGDKVYAVLNVRLYTESSRAAQVATVTGPGQQLEILALRDSAVPNSDAREVWASVRLCSEIGCV